jgi:hypothetical protein
MRKLYFILQKKHNKKVWQSLLCVWSSHTYCYNNIISKWNCLRPFFSQKCQNTVLLKRQTRLWKKKAEWNNRLTNTCSSVESFSSEYSQNSSVKLIAASVGQFTDCSDRGNCRGGATPPGIALLMGTNKGNSLLISSPNFFSLSILCLVVYSDLFVFLSFCSLPAERLSDS